MSDVKADASAVENQGVSDSAGFDGTFVDVLQENLFRELFTPNSLAAIQGWATANRNVMAQSQLNLDLHESSTDSSEKVSQVTLDQQLILRDKEARDQMARLSLHDPQPTQSAHDGGTFLRLA